MAISINKYIDIKSKLIGGSVAGRDWSGLVFSTVAMETTVPTEYTTIKTNYDAGHAVALTKDGIAACFGSTSDVYKFAQLYFGYNGGNHTPTVLNVALVKNRTFATFTEGSNYKVGDFVSHTESTTTSYYVCNTEITNAGSWSDESSKFTTTTQLETALEAYTRVIGEFTNFGAFTFIGSFTVGSASAGGILDVASANESANVQMFYATNSTNATSDLADLANKEHTAVIVATPGSGETNLAAWMGLAWYGSVDYTKTNASATMDYKDFGTNAEVTTDAQKDTYDTAHGNYVGLVQVNGQSLKFYQTGVNMNGIDTGVTRDKLWIQGKIQQGWFELNANSQKIPSNYQGCGLIASMIGGVVGDAINAGAILIDKTLDNATISYINTLANDDTAAEKVQANGYYIATKIFKDGNTYKCEYVLIYAKGDHIVKVTGTNYLA